MDWLLTQLDTNKDGNYDPLHGDIPRDIEMFGFSWGAVTGSYVAQMIQGDNHFVGTLGKIVDKLVMVDPVTFGNRPITGNATVPSNVLDFYNYYQTNENPGEDSGVYIIGIFGPLTGEYIDSNAIWKKEVNFYEISKADPKVTPEQLAGRDHYTIVPAVESTLLQVLVGITPDAEGKYLDGKP